MAFPSNSDQIAGDHLQAFVERIERMHEEKKAISDDIAAIYAEAKGNGFNVKVLREVIRIRSKDAHERAEHETLLDLYMSALGMVRGEDDPSRAPARTREADEFQPPRSAPLLDQRDAFRAGKPISQDFAFHTGSVYFIAFRDLNRVKIGVSRNADLRIADLEATVGDTAEVLAIIPGNRKAEMAAHDHHAKWRVSGEWYRLSDEVLASIADYTATRAGADE